MKKIIVVLVILCASFSGVFASTESTKTEKNSNLSDVLIENTKPKTIEETTACGYSGNVTSGGEVVGHWYSSCTGNFIYIRWCK